MSLGILILGVLACTLNISANPGTGTVRGSGKMSTENRTVKGISGVELAMPGTLYVKSGDSESLSIESEDNLLPYIESDVRNGILQIRTQSGTNLQMSKATVYTLTVTELTELRVSSSGDIDAMGLEGKRCSVDISSSGNIRLGSVDCSSLEVSISSSGVLEVLSGMVERQEVSLSSSGDYRASDLLSSQADLTLSSSGSATINVSDQITGRLSSSGNLFYIGDPRLEVDSTSSGRVEKLKD
jgi:hypothetical protein